MRHLYGAAGLALLVGAAPAGAVEGGNIRGGEHEGFSRIVMEIDPATEWSLETIDGRATIFFPGKSITYTTGNTFDMLPRDRIADVRTGIVEAGTVISVDLGCDDCRVSTSFVGARYLALDVSDADRKSAFDLPDLDAEEEDAPVETAEVSGTPDVPPGLPLAPEQPVIPLVDLTPPNAEPIPLEDRPAVVADAPETDEERDERETQVVSSAEQTLIEQIERAARQGLITLEEADDGISDTSLEQARPQFADTTPPPRPVAPEASLPPTVPMALQKPGSRPNDILSTMLDSGQIQATTVFERESALHAQRLREEASPATCIPDFRLDIAYWSDGSPLFDQVPVMMNEILGEFDEPDPVVVTELAQLYIHFGFGAEAINVLESFDSQARDRALLIEMAKLVDGKRVSPYGPLGRKEPCPGRHGMWLALGGVAPTYHSESHFESVENAFGDLPSSLRLMLGPKLIENLLIAGQPDPARRIYDIIVRSGSEESQEVKIAKAMLDADDGHARDAVQALSSMYESNAGDPVEVLGNMVDIALEANYPVPDRTITDMRGAALEHRGTEREVAIRALLAQALAARNELIPAVTELTEANADLRNPPEIEEAAAHIFANADPEKVGPANFAKVALGLDDLLSRRPENDAARINVARHLLDMSLPNAAVDVLDPAMGRNDEARILMARAHLNQGNYGSARKTIEGDESQQAAEVRARSWAMEGQFDRATEILEDADLSAEAASLAWQAGDWVTVTETETDEQRSTMAKYMAASDGLVEQPPLTEDPSELSPPQAFLEPLPQLDSPSIDATRRLLATGNQLDDFVAEILERE